MALTIRVVFILYYVVVVLVVNAVLYDLIKKNV